MLEPYTSNLRYLIMVNSLSFAPVEPSQLKKLRKSTMFRGRNLNIFDLLANGCQVLYSCGLKLILANEENNCLLFLKANSCFLYDAVIIQSHSRNNNIRHINVYGG